MALITLRVLDGADRGRVFDELATPVTIGREEGNSVQLNDDRVSRFHLKIQEDHEKLVLTDLESTNGTKVNGEEIQLRILRFGDMIAVGRSVLLFGSQEQIASRLAQLRHDAGNGKNTLSDSALAQVERVAALNFDVDWGDEADVQATLHMLEPPVLPERLTPGQAAQLSELIEYLHLRLRYLLETVKVEGKAERLTLDAHQWQSLLDLQGRLASYLRQIGRPE